MFLYAALVTTCISTAQSNLQAQEVPPRATEHQWWYGVGHGNVLDTYLSPSSYTGWTMGVWHRTERLARWGKQRVTVQGLYGVDVAHLAVASDEDKAWDGLLTASGGCHYNWHPWNNTRLALGGLVEGALGFTYLLKGGNNPAQARCSTNLLLSAIAERQFSLWKRVWKARVQLDVPMLGVAFSPQYGQSYYEIFSLGHYNKNIRATHPFNAPSLRCHMGLTIPVGKAMLNIGYMADIRQSEVNHLKHHAWKHYFLVGYTRKLQLIR